MRPTHCHRNSSKGCRGRCKPIQCKGTTRRQGLRGTRSRQTRSRDCRGACQIIPRGQIFQQTSLFFLCSDSVIEGSLKKVQKHRTTYGERTHESCAMRIACVQKKKRSQDPNLDGQIPSSCSNLLVCRKNHQSKSCLYIALVIIVVSRSPCRSSP